MVDDRTGPPRQQILENAYEKLSLSLNAVVGPVPNLQPDVTEKILNYLDLLSRWTSKVDLIAPTTPEGIIDRHICDSLAAWLYIRSLLGPNQLAHIIDIGSGAGLPGVVLALLEPGWELMLVEPRLKRSIFLKEVARQLSLKNINIFNGLMKNTHLENVRRPLALISRALVLESIIKETVQELQAGDFIFQMVGPSFETNSQTHPALRFLSVLEYSLPLSEAKRKLVASRVVRE